jgi:hypothetical protein
MKNLRTILGQEWIEKEVLAEHPEHPLGKWHRKNPDNPVMRHVEELLDVVLKTDKLRCDIPRLASKLSGEFVDTLVELEYAVFLVERGFRVTMEPSAPLAGPDLFAVKDSEYYVEVRRVNMDEVHAAGDLASEDVFARLCETSSRHSVIISMTDEYSAHSAQLKAAVRIVRRTLGDLTKRQVCNARLYYYHATSYDVCDGDDEVQEFDYDDQQKLADQIRCQERRKKARFVARFYDTGQENDRTQVGVLPLGPEVHLLKSDQTYLRLRSILRKKQKQLPKGASGIILLEISELAKLMVDEFTLSAALYGDLQVTIRSGPGFPETLSRKPNGFFMTTTRVSAVVIERIEIQKDSVSARREVWPTNNPNGRVLASTELALFGTIAEGQEDLCAERLRR